MAISLALPTKEPRLSVADVQDTAFKGASNVAREVAQWRPPLLPADLELAHEWQALSARSKDLDRNHGLATSAFQVLSNSIVGTGLRLSPRPDWRRLGKTRTWMAGWAREVESLWETFATDRDTDASRTQDFHGQSRLALRTSLLQGEVLALPLWIEGRGNWGTKIHLLDPDRLSTPTDRAMDPRMRSGIEIDQWEAPVAYHVRRSHPGETRTPAELTGWERIPAYTDWGRPRVLHLWDKDRVGLSRGKAALASVLTSFKMLDRFEVAELQAAVTQSLIAAFVESNLAGEDLVAMFGGSPEEYVNQREEFQAQLKPGSIIQLPVGEKLSSFAGTRPGANSSAFIQNVERRIGASLGLPLELLTKNFSQTNYSSARAALLEAWRYFMGRRAWMAASWHQPIYQLFLEEAIDRRLVSAPGFLDAKNAWCRALWRGPGRGWVDPLKEAQGAATRMGNALSTLEIECAEQGLDWEEVLEQQRIEQDRRVELGLPPLPPLAGAGPDPAEPPAPGAPP